MLIATVIVMIALSVSMFFKFVILRGEPPLECTRLDNACEALDDAVCKPFVFAAMDACCDADCRPTCCRADRAVDLGSRHVDDSLNNTTPLSTRTGTKPLETMMDAGRVTDEYHALL